MKKILLCCLTITILFLGIKADAKQQQDFKAKVTDTYVQKVKTYLNLIDKTYTASYEKDDNYKKVANVFAQYFSESDLDTMIGYFSTPVAEFYALKKNKLWAEVDDIILEKKKETKGNSKTDKKSTDSSYNICKSELDLARDDVRKGLGRYKRVCGVDQFPNSLDNAQDGEADTDNTFFSRVTPYARSYDWSKKGNTYIYTCKSTGKKTTFTYDSKNGTFE